MDKNKEKTIKSYNPENLLNFLEKVSEKINDGAEEIGENKQSIINTWVSDLKTSKDHIVIERNDYLIQKNLLEIENEINYNILIENLSKLSLDNPTERTNAFTFLDKNFTILYNENFSNKLELYFLSLWELHLKKNDWLSLNETVIGLALVLNKVMVKKNFSKISRVIIENTGLLIKYQDYRLRQSLPEIFKIILFEVNDNHELFNSIIKLLVDDILSNFVNNDSKVVNTLESTKLILLELINECKNTRKYTLSFELDIILLLIDRFDCNSSHGVQISSIDIVSSLLEIIKIDNDLLDKILIKVNSNLVDFFAQVRFSSLKFLTNLYELFIIRNSNLIENRYFLQKLVPKVCLNRYIPVEGVRNTALSLWKLIVKENGIKLIKEYFPCFLDTYLFEMASKSPLAKEASCRCLQEIIMKVADDNNKIVIEKKSFLIFSLLKNCIKDSGFNVREAALNSSGYVFNFIFDNINNEEQATLFEYMFLHLFDCVYEVRDASAYAIKVVLSNPLVKKSTQLYNYYHSKALELIKSLENNDNLKKSHLKNREQIFNHIKIDPDLGFVKELESSDYVDGVIHLIKEIFDLDLIKFEELTMILIDYLCKNFKEINNLTKKTIWVTFAQLFQKIKKGEFENYFDYFSQILQSEIKLNSNQLCGYEAINFVKKLYEIYGKRFIANKFKSDTSILQIIDKD